MPDIGTWLVNAYVALLKAPLRLLDLRRRNIFLAHIAEKTPPTVTVQTRAGDIAFHCPGALVEFRARTLLTKEPETIEWIDGFAPSDTFWDIGANIGCYTLYAATRGVRTFTFEPNAFNYSILCRNIQRNGLEDKAMAYCLAFADVTGLSQLQLSTLEAGGAIALFGETHARINVAQLEHPVLSKQGAIGYSIDDFLQANPELFPTHIKIDVDGIEDKILAGAAKTLRDVRLRSVLVEIDESNAEQTRLMRGFLEAAGFSMEKQCRGEFLAHSAYRSLYNGIFRKN